MRRAAAVCVALAMTLAACGSPVSKDALVAERDCQRSGQRCRLSSNKVGLCQPAAPEACGDEPKRPCFRCASQH